MRMLVSIQHFPLETLSPFNHNVLVLISDAIRTRRCIIIARLHLTFYQILCGPFFIQRTTETSILTLGNRQDIGVFPFINKTFHTHN